MSADEKFMLRVSLAPFQRVVVPPVVAFAGMFHVPRHSLTSRSNLLPWDVALTHAQTVNTGVKVLNRHEAKGVQCDYRLAQV